MRIVGMMIVGEGEADRYLRRSLDELKRLCDTAMICFNNADELTKNMVREYGFETMEDNRTWGHEQWRIKEHVTRNLSRLEPDWVISLDADEVFSSNVTREYLEENLCKPTAPAWYAYVVNHWNDEVHHKTSLGFWNIRLWRYWEPWGFEFAHKALHCGLAPKWAYHTGNYAPILLRHFGLMDPKNRKRKIKRYEKYDPKASYMAKWYYDTLADMSPPEKFDESEVLKQIGEEVSKQKIKHKEINPKFMNKKWFYVRRDDGSTIDIPEKHLAATLSRNPNWKIIREVSEQTLSEKTEIPKAVIVPDPLECDVCGFVAKNELGLSRHKMSHK